jgi:hypothetical protein
MHRDELARLEAGQDHFGALIFGQRDRIKSFWMKINGVAV